VRTARIVRVGGSDKDFATLETALLGAGHGTLVRASAAEARELIAARKLDLLVLDLVGSSADIVALIGAAATRDARGGRVPVIVTGPAAAGERIATCLQHGAEDFLTTPFDPQNALLITRRVQLCLKRTFLAADDTAALNLHTHASNRFVPREFLEHLHRESLTDVRLGDHVARDMTVFFVDIRDFTTLSEALTPQQNFDFLNSYLRQVTPIIRSRHGFVDKYIGDGIMALFPRDPADALQAAVELQRQVVGYNVGRKLAGYAPVAVGIGLHHGALILGTIGEEERMQTTVIADAVNVAARIEGLTKTFGTPLLVGGAVVERLGAHGHHLRHLGAVKAKGKTKSVEIYECYDNDDPALVEHKMKTSETFVVAMNEFRKGLFLTAGRLFARIAEQHRGDTAAAYYRDRCALTTVRDRGQTRWDGAEIIEVK
jgi:two-component system, sensor histidine kinase ChiS